jgi:hypothetical protein
LTPYPQKDFPGLDLTRAPASGCIDQLNVDHEVGVIRTRHGSQSFYTEGSDGTYTALSPYYGGFYGVAQIVGVYDTGLAATVRALDITGSSTAPEGSSVTTLASTTGLEHTFARFGSPAGEYLYIANGSAQVRRWDGLVFTSPAGLAGQTGRYLGVQPIENRLVVARESGTTAGNNPSSVNFSNAGDAETFTATNYVDLTPGDGEEIRAVVAWRDLLFVFKQTKFFVFYGNSTDASGNPVFNYRPVDTGIGCARTSCAVAARDAVYFVGERGVYRTSGGPPELVSEPLNPVFIRTLEPYDTASTLQQAELAPAVSTTRMASLNGERILVSYQNTTSARRTLVYDITLNAWMPWSLPAYAMCGFVAAFSSSTIPPERLFFGHSTASNRKLHRMVEWVTDDDGTAIVSRYRTGFSDYGTPHEKSVDATQLWGVGTPNFRWSADFGSLDTAQAVTLGTSPTIASGWHRHGRRGTLLSWEVGASSGAWTLHRAVPHIEASGTPGDQTTA